MTFIWGRGRGGGEASCRHISEEAICIFLPTQATETTDCGSRALSEARKFPSLAEVAFPSHGDLRLYLKDHGVDDSVFVQLFDVGEPDS